MANQELSKIDKRVELTVMKHGNGSSVVVLNSRMICGEFPASAKPVVERTVRLRDIADAFSADDLKEMLEYRSAR